MLTTTIIKIENRLDTFDDYAQLYNDTDPKTISIREKLEFWWMFAQAGAMALSLMSILVMDEIAKTIGNHR